MSTISSISFKTAHPSLSTLFSEQTLSILKIVGVVSVIGLICVGIGYLIYWAIHAYQDKNSTNNQAASLEKTPLQTVLNEKQKPIEIDSLPITMDTSIYSIDVQLDSFIRNASDKPIRGKVYPSVEFDQENIEIIYNPKKLTLQKEEKSSQQEVILLTSNCSEKRQIDTIKKIRQWKPDLDDLTFFQILKKPYATKKYQRLSSSSKSNAQDLSQEKAFIN
jgi:hypothetical protein